MPTFRGIPYTEVWKETHRAVWENDRAKVTRVFDVDWNQSGQFIQQVLGYPAVNGTKVKRITPMPYSSTATWLRAVRVSSAHGIGCPDATEAGPFASRTLKDPTYDTPLYKFNRVVVDFETLPYEIVEDADSSGTDESGLTRYVTIKWHPTAQYLTLPRGLFKWTNKPSSPMAAGVPRLETSMDISITWELAPYIPSAAYDHLGKYNNATFLGKASGTFLLTASDIVPIRSPMGQRLYQINYRFKYFSPSGYSVYPVGATPGHNYILQPPGLVDGSTYNTYVLVTTDGQTTSQTIYAGADYNLLFRPV